MRLNEIYTQDSLFQFGFAKHYKFLETYKSEISNLESAETNKNLLFTVVLELSDTKVIHRRRVYSVNDFLGDVGGVMALIFSLVSVFVNSTQK